MDGNAFSLPLSLRTAEKGTCSSFYNLFMQAQYWN